MKGHLCQPNDLVNYDGIRHKVKEIIGDSIVMLNMRTMCDTVISKFHSVTMVERPRTMQPPGYDWRVYYKKQGDSRSMRLLKKGMSHKAAEDHIATLPLKEGVEYVIVSGRHNK